MQVPAENLFAESESERKSAFGSGAHPYSGIGSSPHVIAVPDHRICFQRRFWKGAPRMLEAQGRFSFASRLQNIARRMTILGIVSYTQQRLLLKSNSRYVIGSCLFEAARAYPSEETYRMPLPIVIQKTEVRSLTGSLQCCGNLFPAGFTVSQGTVVDPRPYDQKMLSELAMQVCDLDLQASIALRERIQDK
jgi:hypothetical protein